MLTHLCVCAANDASVRLVVYSFREYVEIF